MSAGGWSLGDWSPAAGRRFPHFRGRCAQPEVGAGLPPGGDAEGSPRPPGGGREQPKAMLALRRSRRCGERSGGDPPPLLPPAYSAVSGPTAAFQAGIGNGSRQEEKLPGGAVTAPTGAIGTVSAAAGSSTPSALRRQMSRSPLLLRNDTRMPSRLRASTLLRIWWEKLLGVRPSVPAGSIFSSSALAGAQTDRCSRSRAERRTMVRPLDESFRSQSSASRLQMWVSPPNSSDSSR